MRLALPVVGTPTAKCSGCGDCCDPVHYDIAAFKASIERSGSVPQGPEEEFILAHWTPDGNGMAICDAFDPVARRCTLYAERPPVCSRYPWYGRAPWAMSDMSERCSYRADLATS